MASSTQRTDTGKLPPIEPTARHTAGTVVYDRSSLSGDFMVMIAGQTEADDSCRRPESRICEYIGGIVSMPSPASLRHQAEAGIPELWFSDRLKPVLIADRRNEEKHATETVEHGPCHCSGVPGLLVNVDWLWAQPPPKLLGCLQAILAGPPA